MTTIDRRLRRRIGSTLGGAVGVLLSGAIFVTGCSSDEGGGGASKVKIGLLVPITGALETSGTAMRSAAQLAQEEINGAGGVLGSEIELVVRDSATNPEVAREAAQELVDEGVVAVVGEAASSATIASAGVTTAAGVVQISPGSTSPKISTFKDNGLLWRTIPSDTYQGVVAAKYVKERLGHMRASILHVDNAYGSDLAAQFEKNFQSAGGTIVSVVKYPELSAEDIERYAYTEEVKKAFAGEPPLVFVISYFTDGVKIVSQVKQHVLSESYKPKLFGCDGNFGEYFLRNAEASVIESMQGTNPSPPLDDPNYVAFQQAYEARFKLAPGLYAENTYDAIYLLAYAMLKKGNTQREGFAGVLRDLSTAPGKTIGVNAFAQAREEIAKGGSIDYDGASGRIEWDANGDVTAGSYEIWKVQAAASGLEYVREETVPIR